MTGETLRQAMAALGSRLGHVLVAYPNPMSMSVECERCLETWKVEFGLRPEDMLRAYSRALGDVPCRGKPLYTRIEGTPWFRYA